MLKLYVLNDHGEPVQEPDHTKWVQWFEQATRHVAVTEIGCYRVLTVFLGIDYNFGCGYPVLWQTCVFGGEYGEFYRYSTLDDVKKEHDTIVGKLTREQLPRVSY